MIMYFAFSDTANMASVHLASQAGYVLIDTVIRFFTMTAEILARTLAN